MTTHSTQLPERGKPQGRDPDTKLLNAVRAPARGRELIQCRFAAPLADMAALTELADVTFAWADSKDTGWVGIGAVRSYVASGDERFETIRDSVGHDLDAAYHVDEARTPNDEPRSPRVFGGFSFMPATANPSSADPLWEDFGDAHFVLPRFAYERQPGQATLTLTLTREELDDEAQAREWLARVRAFGTKLGRLRIAARPPTKAPAPNASDEAPFAEQVERVLEELERGRARKIVVARRASYEFSNSLSLAGTLHALLESALGSTRFALKLGESAFVGAAPERLVQKRELQIETEALAGTFRTSTALFAEELLRSPKEHSEHAPVLEAIVRELEPVCKTLTYPPAPEIRELPDLLHLHTPVRAVLSEPMHVLDVVRRLHPTPAVGGVPRDLAVDWIAAHEPVSRGWYSGPVGWFDANGDGEFCVALRSGLLSRNRAHLYAGGGIVRGSKPTGEWAETELKLKALGSALRLVEC